MVRIWGMHRLSAQMSPVDDVGIGQHWTIRSIQHRVMKVKTIQVQRHRTYPQSRKPDADCGKHGQPEMKIELAAEAPAVFRKFRRDMREKFAMSTSFRPLRAEERQS